MSSSLKLAIFLGLVSLISCQRQPDWTWRTGRATHYGGPGDGWSVHEGSCEYYYLDRNVGTGWDIVAPGDQNWDWDGGEGGGGSCGLCYEVACSNINFKDGYGNSLGRDHVCYDESASVIVMVTDTCPCQYPTNAYSNKRWCCGDMYHMDISTYAFEKLADKKWGVIGIKYRRVSCDHMPDKRAYLPSGATPTQAERDQPWGWDSSKDKRPRFTTQASAYSSASASGSASASASASSTSGGSSSSGTTYLINQYVQQGWSDGSYSAKAWGSGNQNPDGGQAFCTTVSAGGAASFSGWQGAFEGKSRLEFWVKKNEAGTPDFSIQLSGPKGVCKDISLPGISSFGSKGSDWLTASIPLNAFSWSNPDWASNAASFRGCGSDALSANSVTSVTFKNNRGYDQWLCIDQLKTW